MGGSQIMFVLFGSLKWNVKNLTSSTSFLDLQIDIKNVSPSPH
jgi:hypothetical protein